jgi:CDP-diacylglycerol--glycerol-3-phosphate 3-phosphatidyltransferase
MTDAIVSYFTGSVWLVLFAAYRIRVARRGEFHSERIEGFGGTVVLGENMMQATYWGLAPILRALVAIGLTANAVTTIALVLGLGAGAAVALGHFGLACLLSTVSTLCDVLDGQVARYTGSGTPGGELYDAAVDRYTEFALIAGFAIRAHASSLLVALALVALHASFMISYASAKADALRVSVPRGLMRRHERAACLTLMAGLTPLLGPAVHRHWSELPEHSVFGFGLLLVASIGSVAAVQRLIRIGRALRTARA